jgi:hypothetical protein
MRWWSPMSKTGFCWLWNHPLAWWILLWPTPKKRSLDSNLTTTLVVIYHGVYTDKTRGYNQSRIGAWEPNMDNHWGPAISVHFHPYLAKLMCIYIYILSFTIELANEVKHCSNIVEWPHLVATRNVHFPRLVGLPRLEGVSANAQIPYIPPKSWRVCIPPSTPKKWPKWM